MKQIKFTKRQTGILFLLFFIISLVFTLIVFGLISYLRATPEKYFKKLSSSEEKMSKQIEDMLPELIDKIGVEGVITLVQMSEDKSLLSMQECHPVMHLIGHAAKYRKVDNILYLTEKYGLKCQSGFPHGVEAQITLEENDPVVRRDNLIEYCREYNTYFPGMSCFHGAGHAFYQQFQNENRALQNCDTLENAEFVNLGPCYGGVFSEVVSRVFGVDGETGAKIPGKAMDLNTGDRPLEYCYRFGEKYQVECFSYFSSLAANQSSDRDSLDPCIFPEYTAEAQNACIQFLSSGNTREKLLTSNSFKVPEQILKLSDDYQKEYIKGLASVIFAYSRNGQERDWKTICASFDSHMNEYCIEEIMDTLKASKKIMKTGDL